MRHSVRLALLLGLVQATSMSSAIAQFAPPILPPIQNVPRPQGCMPGQYCPTMQQFGFRCQTPQMWCTLPQPGPIGIPCYCNSPYGPLTGWVQQ